MFKRHKRLSKEVFSAALKSGRRLSSVNLSIVIPQDAKGYAVIVSKKVARLSVTRHKIKRRVLAALRSLSALLPPSLIVFPRASVSSVKYQDIHTEIKNLLS